MGSRFAGGVEQALPGLSIFLSNENGLVRLHEDLNLNFV
jgi:hypothetical protein